MKVLISKLTKGRFLGSNSLYDESLSNKVWRLLESTKGSNECDDGDSFLAILEFSVEKRPLSARTLLEPYPVSLLGRLILPRSPPPLGQ